jgi:hypothetical protein
MCFVWRTGGSSCSTATRRETVILGQLGVLGNLDAVLQQHASV